MLEQSAFCPVSFSSVGATEESSPLDGSHETFDTHTSVRSDEFHCVVCFFPLPPSAVDGLCRFENVFSEFASVCVVTSECLTVTSPDHDIVKCYLILIQGKKKFLLQ